MKVTNESDVSVYTISGATTTRQLPDWLIRRRKRSLKDDPEFTHRVELLQDFEFEEASTAIRVSEDGNWLMSTGTYKPQIHVHDLPQLALSFSRHTISHNITFQLITEDYSKSLHLQTDRRLELHTPMGCHHALRLPRYGRDLQYDRHSAEALIPAVGLDADGNGEVFRLNLEIGRFMRSYNVDVGQDNDPESGRQGSINVGSVNVAAIAETTHNLLAFGTSIGTVEFWDPRSKSRVAALGGMDGQVTAMEFAPNGLSITTGMSTGMVQIFDLRRPAPILTRDQGFGNAIKKIIHMTTASEERKIMSADKEIIKIWDEQTGEGWTTIEPAVDMNDIAWCKGTGMLLSANEGRQQHSFFVPQLGPAPKWCSFLDNMVEEMAEDHTAETYDNYKFLSVPQLKEFSLDHLIGKSNLLRPYMHGFFVANKLYEQARLICNPYMYEEEQAKKVKQRVERDRESRIRGTKKIKAAQNQNLVNKLAESVKTRDGVSDSRFGTIFKDDRFVVDEQDEAYLVHNAARKNPTVAAFMSDESDAEPSRSKNTKRSDKDPSVDSDVEMDEDDDVVMQASSTTNRGREKKDSSFGSRVKQSGTARREKAGGDVIGERQITFMPERKGKNADESTESGRTKKRSDARRSASGNTLRDRRG